MKIIRLSTAHFKALGKYTLDTHGKDVTIEGQNGLGKTSVFDAAMWVLTDKDSLGQSPGHGFKIKPLNAAGEVAKHKLDYEAELVIEHDGREIALRKVYKEVWGDPRKEGVEKLLKHETNRFIDSVPTDERPYNDFIASICDPKRLLILSRPTYFNELPDAPGSPGWQQRRNMLVSAFGDVTDAEVMGASKKFKPLVDELKGKTVDDFKKVLTSSRKDIVKGRQDIPGRIDELSRGLDGADGVGGAAPESSTQSLRDRLKELNINRASILAGGQAGELTKRLRELEAEGQAIYSRLRQKAEEEAHEAQKTLRQANFVLDGEKQKATRLHYEIEQDKVALAGLDKDLASLRADFTYISNNNPVIDEACPTCGQGFPLDKIQELQEAWNLNKAKSLEDNRERGKACKAKADQMREKINRKLSEIGDMTTTIEELTRQRDGADQVAQMPKDLPMLSSPEYKANDEKQFAVKAAIAEAATSTDTTAIDEEIAECELEIKAQDEAKARVQAQAEARERITELEAQEKAMGAEIEAIDKMLFLIEEFTKAKVAMLDDKINSHFEKVRFKLSETQINEGIAPCCICTMNGTPWTSLSTGERIIAGLDVICTLSKAWGLTIPVFVDNSESVTMELKAPGQLIALRAVEGLKKLTVKVVE